MHRITLLTAIAGSCLACSLGAQDCTISAGVTYRRLGTADFKGRAFANPALGASPFVNGTLATGAVGTPLAVQNAPLQVVGNLASIDSLSAASGDDDFGGAAGAALSLGCTVMRSGPWALTWDVNSSWAAADLSRTAAATVTTAGYTVALPAVIPPNIYTIAFAPGAGTATTQGWLQQRLDVDAYALGTGFSGSGTWKRFSLSVGAGVSACLADANSRATETVQWLDGTALYSRRDEEDTLKVVPGTYASVGLSVSLTAALSAGVEYRYDWFFGELHTEVAEVDLNGGAFQFKLSYRF